ncbi:unnamed protein product [Protopolystoma xenopodis]|uniref:Uncharacterized protein n=1 Tax=Protopolystoma xenopodis TaxID=117903 RepID=A0A3S5FBM5_9PLAT|nr:unnamed protein product [Protopolystoma xenopodis]
MGHLAIYAPGVVTIIDLLRSWLSAYRHLVLAPPALDPARLHRGHCLSTSPQEHLLPPPDFLPSLQLNNIMGKTLGSALTGASAQLGPILQPGAPKGSMPSPAATRAMLRLRHLIDPAKTPFYGDLYYGEGRKVSGLDEDSERLFNSHQVTCLNADSPYKTILFCLGDYSPQLST